MFSREKQMKHTGVIVFRFSAGFIGEKQQRRGKIRYP
jgi:hypothetical protein